MRLTILKGMNLKNGIPSGKWFLTRLRDGVEPPSIPIMGTSPAPMYAAFGRPQSARNSSIGRQASCGRAPSSRLASASASASNEPGWAVQPGHGPGQSFLGQLRGEDRQQRRAVIEVVKKRQRRLSGVDEIVLSLYAKGLTTRVGSACQRRGPGYRTCGAWKPREAEESMLG